MEQIVAQCPNCEHAFLMLVLDPPTPNGAVVNPSPTDPSSKRQARRRKAAKGTGKAKARPKRSGIASVPLGAPVAPSVSELRAKAEDGPVMAEQREQNEYRRWVSEATRSEEAGGLGLTLSEAAKRWRERGPDQEA